MSEFEYQCCTEEQFDGWSAHNQKGVSFCFDCTPKYRAKMTALGNCKGTSRFFVWRRQGSSLELACVRFRMRGDIELTRDEMLDPAPQFKFEHMIERDGQLRLL